MIWMRILSIRPVKTVVAKQMIAMARKVAESEASAVLLQGESGAGKDLVAKAIHYSSRRSGEPFIAINCAAIPPPLIESELFGYEKGAFTLHCMETTKPRDDSARDKFKKQVEASVRRWTGVGHCPPAAYEGIIISGVADEAIIKTAAEHHIDLMVMSSRRPAAAAMLGSTAEAVCRTAPCPVLITHPSEREWVGMTSVASMPLGGRDLCRPADLSCGSNKREPAYFRAKSRNEPCP
jgi:sigma-54 interacting transcriptional regulator/universal stress protein family protein